MDPVMKPPTWRDDIDYKPGDIVLYGSNVYRARIATPAGYDPATHSGYWERLRGAGIDTPAVGKLDLARRIDPRIGRGA